MSEAKRQLVQSWLTKAQHDLALAHVLAASDLPLLYTAIYHCQQAAEKAVKGFLVFCDQEFERVHRMDEVRLADDIFGLVRLERADEVPAHVGKEPVLALKLLDAVLTEVHRP